MIRQEYAEQLKQTRKDDPNWGSTAALYAGADVVRLLHRNKQVRSILDFGCGKGTLAQYIRQYAPLMTVSEYDPSVPGKDTIPDRQFDMIVSTDVMEHIEPESLTETLEWIQNHARLGQFHVIACGPTNKVLPDGRDVHLIQQPINWWVGRMAATGWTVMEKAEISQMRRGTVRHRGHLYLEKS